MSSGFGNLSSMENQDLIGTCDGGQSVTAEVSNTMEEEEAGTTYAMTSIVLPSDSVLKAS